MPSNSLPNGPTRLQGLAVFETGCHRRSAKGCSRKGIRLRSPIEAGVLDFSCWIKPAGLGLQPLPCRFPCSSSRRFSMTNTGTAHSFFALFFDDSARIRYSSIARRPACLSTSSSPMRSEKLCGRCQTHIRAISSGRAMAIRAVPPKRSSGRTGKLFKLAKIVKPGGTPKRCHPHMFRDTFAVELLVGGCLSIKCHCCWAIPA